MKDKNNTENSNNTLLYLEFRKLIKIYGLPLPKQIEVVPYKGEEK